MNSLVFPAKRLSAREVLFDTAMGDYSPSLVRINSDRLRGLSIPKTELTIMNTGLPGTPPGANLRSGIAYLLVLNSQNFQFWDVIEDQFVRYDYEGLVGATGMRRAFDKAWGPSGSCEVFAETLARNGVDGIFGRISAPGARQRILNEMLGLVDRRLPKLAEQLEQTIRREARLTLEDAREIARTFPESYADPYLKKAQLTLAEITGFCAENGLEVDCSELTLCADYQLPRVLRALGVLEYSPEVASVVDNQVPIEKDSLVERALRSATIFAGQSLAHAFDCTAAAVDNYLWTRRKLAGEAPFHLTRTTAY